MWNLQDATGRVWRGRREDCFSPVGLILAAAEREIKGRKKKKKKKTKKNWWYGRLAENDGRFSVVTSNQSRRPRWPICLSWPMTGQLLNPRGNEKSGSSVRPLFSLSPSSLTALHLLLGGPSQSKSACCEMAAPRLNRRVSFRHLLGNRAYRNEQREMGSSRRLAGHR